MIYLGCSGWAYQEWKENFYGGSSPSLQYYSHFFNAVEVDSTYYSIPSVKTVHSWIQRHFPGVNFSVKLPGEISHGEFDSDYKIGVWKRFRESVVEPILKVQGYLNVMMTIPPGIHDIESYITGISEISSSFEGLCIEPRTGNRNEYREYSRIIRIHGFIPVSVDNFHLHLSGIEGNRNICYIRLHGRNPSFLKAGSGMEKFNYAYSGKELEEIGQEIIGAKERFKEVYIFFNNHPNGNAPMNAGELSHILGLRRTLL